MLRKGDTAARHVHAVLAAAVDDPAVLRRLRRESRKAGAATVDLDRVRLFAGLAVKVRQNDVRLSLPLTFKILDLLKISIEFFASYAEQAAVLRKANRKARDDKIQSIIAFLCGWLDQQNPSHRLVHDIGRHEHALIRLRGRAVALVPGPDAVDGLKATPKSVPRRAEPLICHEMNCDPLELERQLRSRSCDLSSLRRGQRYCVYRWDRLQTCVSVVEVDELGYVLIDLANGRRSVAAMTAWLNRAGIEVDAATLCDAVQHLIDNDMLALTA